MYSSLLPTVSFRWFFDKWPGTVLTPSRVFEPEATAGCALVACPWTRGRPRRCPSTVIRTLNFYYYYYCLAPYLRSMFLNDCHVEQKKKADVGLDPPAGKKDK